ncbi:MAG: PKD repeat protein, partial [Bacteroidia bacterium]
MKKILPFLMLLFGLSVMSDVQAQCKADFSYYTNGNGTFVFVDSSGTYFNTDDWTFGDGTSASNTSGQVTHTYSATGNFTVCRMVWDSTRSCRDTFCTRITYTTTTCSALFSYSVSGDTVTFADNSTNAVYHSWDFGDFKSSASVNPVHKYSGPGTYKVCLTII